jgi:replicative DNA helicase
MDIERALVSKIITSGQLPQAVAKGIRAEHFADTDCKDVYLYLLDHSRTYGSPPTEAAVKNDKSDFTWEYVQDPIEYLLDRFIQVVKRRFAQDMAVELAEACDDPVRSKNIDHEFFEVSRKLATLIPSTEVARFKDMHSRVSDYRERAKLGIKTGIPFGWPTLDEWTGGIQPHEFVTVSGFSGLGKSTMLMKIAFNAWVAGHTPLIISLEMEAGTILRKFDAMAAGLDYQAMKQLKLPEDQIDHWEETAQKIREKTAEIPVIDNIRSCNPDHVFAETIRHKPDLVVIDYLSLMRSSRPSRGMSVWQSITEITQDLKQNARTLKIPIVAAAQTNRSGGKEGAELDNIGYSLSIVQDSDIVLGLFADDEMRERREMEIRLRKNRDGRLGEYRVRWDHETMDFREKTKSDMFTRDRDEPVQEPAAAPEVNAVVSRPRPRPKKPESPFPGAGNPTTRKNPRKP